jgi:hypothetical protein
MFLWNLICRHCFKPFVFAEIGSSGQGRYDGLTPRKPAWPVNGLSIECPLCSTTDTYLCQELVAE